jgi:riboflavin biosynthesis pyrimidine reductase
MRLLLDRTGNAGEEPYERLSFAEPPGDRPTIIVNMVCTLDGRTANAGSGRALGSRTDRRVMDRIRAASNAVLIGAGTLRADSRIRFPDGLLHAVVSASGDLPYDAPFFTRDPELAILFMPHRHHPPAGVRDRVTAVNVAGKNLPLSAARWLRKHRDVHVLLVEGGPTVNGQLFEGGSVDELFLTVAPLVCGGAGPSILTAPAFGPGHLPGLELLALYEEEGELFLRYRSR